MRMPDAELPMAEIAARIAHIARLRMQALKQAAAEGALMDGTGIAGVLQGRYTMREMIEIARRGSDAASKKAARLSSKVMPMGRGERRLAEGLAARK